VKKLIHLKQIKCSTYLWICQR